MKNKKLQVPNAILFVARNGCKWRGLPEKFGKWHMNYNRMNRWAKSGVLDRILKALEHTNIIQIRVEAV